MSPHVFIFRQNEFAFKIIKYIKLWENYIKMKGKTSSSMSIKRILTEAKEIRDNPNPNFHAEPLVHHIYRTNIYIG